MACGVASASGERSQAALTVIDMMLLRRIAPALLLIVLAPLIAEFLLGDFTVRSLPLIFVLGWQYGGGALLIREVSRRLRRGWPTMLLLALAYGLIEEGFTTQSLFNPNYVGQRLLDYGFLPPLGTSLNWCVYVLGLHVVWSIATPILIAEGMSADRRETPWLHRPGLAVTVVAFVLGCALTTFFTLISDPFVASLPQLILTGGLVIAAVAAACVVKPDFPERQPSRSAPAAWVVGGGALLLASAFVALPKVFSPPVPPVLPLVGLLACASIAGLLIVSWSASPAWGPDHYLALAGGTVLAYAWSGLDVFIRGSTKLGAPVGSAEIVGQFVLILAILGLIAWGIQRSRSSSRHASVRVASVEPA